MSRPVRTSTPLLLAALLFAGCAGRFTNALFDEDAEFLAALPDEDRATVDYDSTTAGRRVAASVDLLPNGAPDLRVMTEEISTQLNGMVMDVLQLVDVVRKTPPTRRETGRRTWGPWSVGAIGGNQLQVVIDRTGVGQYDWDFAVSSSKSGPWTDVFRGTHYAGSSVAHGDGVFTWDMDALASVTSQGVGGTVGVDYDNRSGREFLMDIDGLYTNPYDAALTASYWYRQDEDDNGDFEYETMVDVDKAGALETALARTRWMPDGSGRSDVWFSGGDLETELSITECWDASLEMVYVWDSYGIFDPVGDAAACVFVDAEYPEHI